jgi:hypothetical protein
MPDSVEDVRVLDHDPKPTADLPRTRNSYDFPAPSPVTRADGVLDTVSANVDHVVDPKSRYATS